MTTEKADLVIKLGQMLAKSDEEHRADIEALFEQIESLFKQKGFRRPYLEWERGGPEPISGALHFLTRPVLARIHIELEDEKFAAVMTNDVQPVVLNWLDSEPKKSVNLEIRGRYILRFSRD